MKMTPARFERLIRKNLIELRVKSGMTRNFFVASSHLHDRPVPPREVIDYWGATPMEAVELWVTFAREAGVEVEE